MSFGKNGLWYKLIVLPEGFAVYFHVKYEKNEYVIAFRKGFREKNVLLLESDIQVYSKKDDSFEKERVIYIEDGDPIVCRICIGYTEDGDDFIIRWEKDIVSCGIKYSEELVETILL